MINLFFEYTEKSQDLESSLKAAGYQHPTVVIKDNGFLPSDVESPLKYFLQAAGSKFQGRPRYFNEIDLPEYWEIKANAQAGEVLNHGQQRGQIKYWKNDRKRLVSEVSWLDEQGRVRIIDHYNQWGWKYAVTSCDKAGNQAMTSYFADNGQEILIQNHFTGDYTYNAPDGKIYNFTSLNQLTAYYLDHADYKMDGVIFNSLGTCLFTLINLKNKPKRNMLFWQERSQGNVPDNMLYLLHGKLPESRVVIQNKAEYEKITGQLGEAERAKVSYLGTIYPFRRENQHRKRALTFTNSDQIEGLKQIVEALPEVHFDIAAITEMSSRLMGFGHYDNVALYPVVRDEDAQKLLAEDDLYLDINYANEILQAGRQAFENQQLILAFRDTLHASKYTAPENIFAAQDFDGLIAKIKKVLENPSVFNESLRSQEVKAETATASNYQNELGNFFS
ncbi:Accessory Sec system glycosyltransferase GtfB [Lactobacillus equicursoris 66c]|uniref:UDP-N-acetylglucosamine--peptide N-acetylglucosaminyltransferase stabilizing protein GtfB n=1 Tax=Lactobacillus equicursoris 66c TaxID=872326 RepID=K0NGJ5_9LACO|nr:accessory Sec system glycosylation chaperone GtfB [Lactobacillus equicursoris]CCK84467.1 Accessory Sec system glycosyltransferase GtfB [Lactobacillus equicursoris 66c]